MDIYRDVILDHYKHPRNFGHLPKPNVTAAEDNVTCGDRIVMEVMFTRNKQTKQIQIADIRFSGEGCAISQASASLLTEKVKQIPIQKVLALTTDDILSMLGTALTPSRIKCAVLPLEVLQKAIQTKK